MNMKFLGSSALLLASLAASLPSAAAQERQGRLGTLPHGTYICSVPGDAAGPAWIDLPGKDFIIDNASTYRTAEGAGTYLLTGNNIVFTRGPMNGMRFRRTGTATLRWVDDRGESGRIRCVRRSGNG